MIGRSAMPHDTVVAVANYQCQTGENPLWNVAENRIYWEDIDSGRLFRAEHQSLEHECFHQGPVIGGFTFQADGSLLLFEQAFGFIGLFLSFPTLYVASRIANEFKRVTVVPAIATENSS